MASPTSQPKRGDWYSTGTGNNTEVYEWSGSQWSKIAARSGRPSGNQWNPEDAEAFKNPSTGNPGTTPVTPEVEKLSFTFLAPETNGPIRSTLSYPEILDKTRGDVDYVQFKFKKYEPPFSSRSQQTTGNAGATGRSALGYNSSVLNLQDSGLPPVLMYMPEDIAARYGSEWGGKSIQNATVSAFKSTTDTGAVMKDIFSNWKNSGQNAGDALTTALVSEGLSALSNVGQGEGLNINDFFGSTRGIVINPNTELLFVGFNLRSFDLNFKMVARTQFEAKMIRDIITTFKKAMLPSQIENKNLTDEGAKQFNQNLGEGDRENFIKVPNLVEIMFMHNGRNHEFLPQYKPCAITEVGVNYTADGTYATYRDGEPVAITLSLRFAETKLVYSEEIRYGGVSF